MNVLESEVYQPVVPCRCMVRGRTAKACGQSPKPAQKQKVKVGGRRADRRPAGELMSSRVGRGVARRDSTPREHRQQVHRSAGPLRAPGVLLRRWRNQTNPTSPAGGEQKSGARRPICMGQKAFRHSLGTTFTSDKFTGSKEQRVGRGTGDDSGRCEGAIGKPSAGLSL